MNFSLPMITTQDSSSDATSSKSLFTTFIHIPVSVFVFKPFKQIKAFYLLQWILLVLISHAHIISFSSSSLFD